MVSSSIAARNPPCTFPAGLRKISTASNLVSMVPRSPSISTKPRPSVLAHAGGGKRPSAIFQKNESLFKYNSPVAAAIVWLAHHVKSRQHLLDRAHCRRKFLRIAGADHEVGVRLLVLVEKR